MFTKQMNVPTPFRLPSSVDAPSGLFIRLRIVIEGVKDCDRRSGEGDSHTTCLDLCNQYSRIRLSLEVLNNAVTLCTGLTSSNYIVANAQLRQHFRDPSNFLHKLDKYDQLSCLLLNNVL